MGQLVASWFICKGRFKVHAINAVGKRRGRIIEIEEMATGERTHGSADFMEWLTDRLSRRKAGTVGQTTRALSPK
jgi:hypothetical protein